MRLSMSAQRPVLVLGSTGSIGRSALAVLREHPDRFTVAGLAARERAEDVAAQWREFRPAAVAMEDPAAAARLRGLLRDEPVEVLEGTAGVLALIKRLDPREGGTVLVGIAGAAGLSSTAAAVRRGLRVALANKESLVMAGPALLAEARRTGASILPVDSEHCAVAQAMLAGRREEVRRVLLTASGGALRDVPVAALRDATPADALRHPTWAMGRRITVDSATLLNKALEIVEAVHLFELPPDRVEVVLHAQSVVHSLVEFRDGSVMAQLGRPDMRLPILWALAHPERPDVPAFRLEVAAMARLDFAVPDPDRYPGLALGWKAASRGGLAGAVLNAADERAVELFLEGRVRFTDIATLVGRALDAVAPEAPAPDAGLDAWLAAAAGADAAARAAVDAGAAR
jgi:1-deoxy-D-xylulose-5-phosphate reductoisomerase